MEERGYSRREWMVAFAGTAGCWLLSQCWGRKALGPMEGRREDAFPTAPLHPSLAQLVPYQDDEVAFDPVCSSLDRLEVVMPEDERSPSSEGNTGMWSLSFTPAGLETWLLSDNVAALVSPLGLNGAWKPVSQSEESGWVLRPDGPAHGMEAARALVRRARSLVGAGRSRTQPACLNAQALGLARRLDCMGLLDRAFTSPFSQVAFSGPAFDGVWVKDELLVWVTQSPAARRIAEHVVARGAGQPRRRCFRPVAPETLVSALEPFRSSVRDSAATKRIAWRACGS